MVPSKYLKYINLFKQQLDVVNASFLSKHLIGVVNHKWVTYRDPDRDWFYKDYDARLDSEAEAIVGMNSSKAFYQIMNSDMRDVYLCYLISSFDIQFSGVPYDKDEDTQKLKEHLVEWKSEILTRYSRDEHIRAFMWHLLRCEYNHDVISEVEVYLRESLCLDNTFSFYQFDYDGLNLELTDFVGRKIKIKAFSSFWSNFTLYGQNRQILPDQEIIEIPNKIYHYSLGDLYVNSIGKGVFESLKKCKKIILPKSLNNIEWSFWECKKLERIELPSNSWDNLHYKSIDGVLYSGDGKSLLAYPNAHGDTYEVPEGVTTIKKFAFKSCDSITTLILPSTIELIEINAFYRCSNLKRIICNMPLRQFKFEGYCGDYGKVDPQWYYIDSIDR